LEHDSYRRDSRGKTTSRVPLCAKGRTEDQVHVRAAARSALAADTQSGHIGHVKKLSLAQAKAHISELVSDAEHRGRRTLILRHGKAAAAIVPVDVATPKPPPAVQAMTESAARQSVEAFVDEFSASDPDGSAVDDLRASRR
jgi:antitoxin (DNA-binding transcriptional repressor) of toxin-antitoxin stability system